MANLYNELRQFGEDIRGALMAGPEARLKGIMTKQSLDELQAERLRKKALEAKELQKEQMRGEVATEIGKNLGPMYGKMYALGESSSAVTDLYKAQHPPEKRDRPDRYARALGTLDTVAMKLGNQFGTTSKQIADAQAKGQDTTALQEQAVAEYNAGMATLNRLKASFEDFDPTFNMRLSDMADAVIAGKDEATIGLVSEAVTQGLKKYRSGRIREIADIVEENKTKWSAYANTSGVPSSSDLRNILAATTLPEGESPQKEMLKKLMDVRDPDTLVSIIEDEDTPDPLKTMGFLMLKKALASKAVGVAMEEEKKKRAKKVAGQKASVERLRGKTSFLGKL